MDSEGEKVSQVERSFQLKGARFLALQGVSLDSVVCNSPRRNAVLRSFLPQWRGNCYGSRWLASGTTPTPRGQTGSSSVCISAPSTHAKSLHSINSATCPVHPPRTNSTNEQGFGLSRPCGMRLFVSEAALLET